MEPAAVDDLQHARQRADQVHSLQAATAASADLLAELDEQPIRHGKVAG